MSGRKRPSRAGASARRDGEILDIGAEPSPAAPTYPRRRGAPANRFDVGEAHGEATVPRRGYRTSKRSTKAGKRARREERIARLRAEERAMAAGVARFLRRLATAVLIGALIVGLAIGSALAINAAARHLAKRAAERAASPEAVKEQARDNLLIIGTDPNGGTDFLAVRLDRSKKQITGIAISDGAFMEVPGQGFERAGDSFKSGPETSLATISNYLGVLFDKYVVVPKQVYQDALTSQSLAGLFDKVSDTNLNESELAQVRQFADSLGPDRVALAPLPVRPINMGDQTYFEPQRDKIADLLMAWWGVKVGAEEARVSVVIYNGSGVPGIAGEVAERLIREGMRVADTKNADRFDYEQTLIVEQREGSDAGERIQRVLGVGKVIVQPSEQQVADIIIIVGKDYKPVKE
ncbi:LytR C-terminal domain-containing protein [Coriobacteriia bacterium Es71-Z0120]|uniref:LCP family protein n=1 Tax=Parvivirga hydrogeniphila TaxID=2939460 RepID=UPI0022608BDF|nr:LytR C-terminal domain-containing protein [Parvivirga hydrogeniphila]MCL4078978.1 LytR C-terminal domain-containing protein [Parvivirga hydrogeniphila]